MTTPLASTTLYTIGVDVGGTKVAAAVVDAKGQIMGKVKVATNASHPEAALESIVGAVRQVLEVTGTDPLQISGVGLGVPGQVDHERGVAELAVNLGWRDMPVRDHLEKRLGMPCIVENDVSVAALGEGRFGLARGRSSMAYLSLGTGIAARSIVAGQLLRGATGLAGEIGHLVIAPDGPPCACGARGCLEALAGGPAIARQATEALEAGRTSSLSDRSRTIKTITAEDVFAAALQGDTLAEDILTLAGMHIAYGISLLALTVNPEVVVLGGGLARPGGPLVAAITKGFASWQERSPVVRAALDGNCLFVSELGLDAALLGAASLILAPQLRSSEETRHD